MYLLLPKYWVIGGTPPHNKRMVEMRLLIVKYLLLLYIIQ